jgi:Ca2+-binding RTX toxin-like protein
MKRTMMFAALVAVLTAMFATAAFAATFTGTTNKLDYIRGTKGDDEINSLRGPDTVHARAGNDIVFGSGGYDDLHGQGGNDQLTGGGGKDWLAGGNGGDKFYSHDGYKDAIYCGSGVDKVFPDERDFVDRDCEIINGKKTKK